MIVLGLLRLMLGRPVGLVRTTAFRGPGARITGFTGDEVKEWRGGVRIRGGVRASAFRGEGVRGCWR